jgi:hypothetical protein
LTPLAGQVRQIELCARHCDILKTRAADVACWENVKPGKDIAARGFLICCVMSLERTHDYHV